MANPSSVYCIKAPASGSSKMHKLVFTTTSLRNVVLANASDVLYYEVVTPVWERHRTRVSRMDVKTRKFHVVAEMLNGHPPGDTRGHEEEAKRVMAVRLYGGEFKAIDEFLHVELGEGSEASGSTKGKGKAKAVEEDDLSGAPSTGSLAVTDHWSWFLPPVDRRAWFCGKDGTKHTWYASAERLELVSDDRPGKPVAAYHKEKRYMNLLRMSQYPYLEVDPSMIENLDYLVLSFLLVERLRRERGGS